MVGHLHSTGWSSYKYLVGEIESVIWYCLKLNHCFTNCCKYNIRKLATPPTLEHDVIYGWPLRKLCKQKSALRGIVEFYAGFPLKKSEGTILNDVTQISSISDPLAPHCLTEMTALLTYSTKVLTNIPLAVWRHLWKLPKYPKLSVSFYYIGSSNVYK